MREIKSIDDTKYIQTPARKFPFKHFLYALTTKLYCFVRRNLSNLVVIPNIDPIQILKLFIHYGSPKVCAVNYLHAQLNLILPHNA